MISAFHLTDLAFIGVPPGTRLEAIWHNSSTNSWDIWIAVKNKSLPYSQWVGTFLRLHQDGHVQRITICKDGYEDIMEIKP